MKFLINAVPKLMEVTSETSTKDIIEVVSRAYGQEIMLRQAQKVKAYLLRKRKHNKCRRCGQDGHNRRNCQQQQSQQQAGSGPSAENIDATMQSDSEGEELSSSDSYDEPPRTQEQHCRLCHQAGHNRRNCRQKGSQSQTVPAPPPSTTNRPYNRAVQESLQPVAVTTMTEDPQYNFSDPPDMSDHNIFHSSGVPEIPSDSSSRAAPVVHTNVFAAQQAARLMREAARLTQEAARLNHEAATLMASVLG